MELSIEGLKDKTAWEAAGISIPGYNISEIVKNTKTTPKWVHFGIGNIFRIFLGGIADSLLEQGLINEGITCVDTYDFEVVDKIYKPFDNLVLAVTLRTDGKTDKKVIGSLSEAIKAQSDVEEYWDRLKNIFANENLQMVTFTITEKAYALKDIEENYFSSIQNDIDNGPQKAKTAMAIITALLYERYKAGATPVAMVSMDNCSHNGEKLKASVITMANEWKEKKFVDQGFIEYISDETKVAFPWTMIDKITPRPAKSIADTLRDDGLFNMEPVVTSKNTYAAPYVNAEAPQYLVVEDRFPNGRPPLEKAGVYMTDRETVNKVERMKVTTCLNPLHTALAVYGCLLGYTLIADEMKDRELNRLVCEIGLTEGLPVVTDPVILSPQEFLDEVIKVRLPNPFMPDTPQRIATDTSQKVAIRFGETIKAYVTKFGNADKLIAIPLALAGWLRYLLGVDDAGDEFELSPDPMLLQLKEQLSGIKLGQTYSDLGKLREIISNSNIFGIDLYEAGIGAKVEQMFLEEIEGVNAVRNTLKKYLD